MESANDMCASLHDLVRRLPRYQLPVTDSGIGDSGVYFLFENGENAHSGERIVLVACHTGEGNLASRLREHTTPNKDRSIFRKNVGRASLSKAEDPFLATWERDLTSAKQKDLHGNSIDAAKLTSVEREVTDYIVSNFSVTVIPFEDMRLDFKALCIATVAQCGVCRPSANWLGGFSPKSKIRTSGLWQEKHLSNLPLTAEDFDVLTSQTA